MVTGHGAEVVEAAVAKTDPDVDVRAPGRAARHRPRRARRPPTRWRTSTATCSCSTATRRSCVPRRSPRCSRPARRAPRWWCSASRRPTPAATAGSCSDADGGLEAIVEARDADPADAGDPALQLGRDRRRSRDAVLAARARSAADNATGEIYLTDIVAHRPRPRAAPPPRSPAREAETLGRQLARRARRRRGRVPGARPRRRAWRTASRSPTPTRSGSRSTPMSAATWSIGPNVVFGLGVTVESGATIRPFCHLDGCHISRGAEVGPFARLRPGAELAEDVHDRQLRRGEERDRRRGRQDQPPHLRRRRRMSARGPTSAPAPSSATTTACSSTAPRSARAPSSARTPRWSRRSASATRALVARRLDHHRGRARRGAGRGPRPPGRSSPASAAGSWSGSARSRPTARGAH